MTAEPINVGEKYSALDGLTYVYVPTIAAGTLIPTRTEIDDGVDLSTEVIEWEGFEITSDGIELKGLKRFKGEIPGMMSAAESSLTLYADRGNDDVSSILPRDTAGFILRMPVGDVPTKKMSVWPIRVKSLTPVFSTEAATAYKVAMSITAEPNESVTIPAAATP
ncbi:hypothetical protein Psed_5795 [Pseudonocardia dioxanivorans CB1190]|uniref:Uncharacterized protein n=1 Tax=Pseudonocardia dioxanivorans (strain ATCC 55486 / DSM 44775 / JCM 13855 / CB1190) TaxID=675635 RepID=F4D1D4_PSEUX|nr:hypothetical protein [Pseudonocardia dioxanivorans]AEA27922.1 hypothetical protein Psed_5795 [Pseudonocardia dioxanivorans CB1190]